MSHEALEYFEYLLLKLIVRLRFHRVPPINICFSNLTRPLWPVYPIQPTDHHPPSNLHPDRTGGSPLVSLKKVRWAANAQCL